MHGGPAPSPIRGANYKAASSVEKHPGKQYRRRARFKSGAASIMKSERRGQVLNTYQIRYKQFPRSRRSIRTLHIEADSLQNARINFLKAINLMKKLQHYTPFWCDHICIVDTWEVASNG
jgi:hypothetical protein